MRGRLFTLTLMALAIHVLSGCATTGNDALLPSDVQIKSAPDGKYDHLIVPGERIGPFIIGHPVKEGLMHIGNPDRVTRRASPWLFYHWWGNGGCLNITFKDNGLDPVVQSVNVSCDKWQTADGLRTGLTLDDIQKILSAPGRKGVTIDEILGRGTVAYVCSVQGSVTVYTKDGLRMWLEHRNAPVSLIEPVTQASMDDPNSLDYECIQKVKNSK